MLRRVVFSPSAARELDDIFDYIAESGSPRAVVAFVNALTKHCETLAGFSSPGRPVGRGIRILVFRRRATIAYRFSEADVTILSVAYAGRDWTSGHRR